MNIKRFIAKDAREALNMVKRELGSEAVILRTRTIPSRGEDPATSKKMIEVTAAVDYESHVDGAVDSRPVHDALEPLETELREIKNVLLCHDADSVLKPEFFFDRNLRDRYIHLKTFGLRPEIIRDLMDGGNGEHRNRTDSSRLLQESLVHVLSRIHIEKNGGYHDGRKIYSFIGPTGVGKTTTLAKLAAMSAIQRGEKTALITLDTFRIAATAQLQTYARIMDIPLEVAVTKKDFQKAVDKHDDCDRILIDTAGRSPNNEHDIEELRNLLGIHKDIHSFLVLSANTQYQSLLSAEQRFGVLPYKSYIFTKLDETQDISTIINFLISRDKPVSFFTTGQQVPEDIEFASKKRLAKLLLNGMNGMSKKDANKGNRDGSSYWS